MALPNKRSTKGRKLRRAAHFALKKTSATSCQKCGKAVLPHHVCASCGFYKGRDVLKLTKKHAKKSVSKA